MRSLSGRNKKIEDVLGWGLYLGERKNRLYWGGVFIWENDKLRMYWSGVLPGRKKKLRMYWGEVFIWEKENNNRRCTGVGSLSGRMTN